MATLSPEDIKNVESLIKIYAEDTENLTDNLKQMYRDSIKSNTRKDFITTCFNTYALFKDTEKMQILFKQMGKGMFSFANMLPSYKNFMEWLSTNTGKPL